MGNKPAYSAEMMIQALRDTKGMVYLAADRIGCAVNTVYNYIDRYPTVKAAFEEASGRMLDEGETKLYEHVINGDAWAVCFLLRTKGKHRGYVERQEVTGPDGKDIVIKVVYASDST